MAKKKTKKKKTPAKRKNPPKKKHRTAAQIAATRKLVAMNKARKNAGKKNVGKKKKAKRAKVSRGSQPRKKPTTRKNNGVGDITDWTPCSAVKVRKNEDGELTLYIKPRL